MSFVTLLDVKINKYHSTFRTLSLLPQWVRWCAFRKTSSDVLPVESVVKKKANSRETYVAAAYFLLLQRIGRNKNVKTKRIIIVVILMMLSSLKHQFISFYVLDSLTPRLFCPPFPMTRHRPSPPQLPSVNNRKNRKKETPPRCEWHLALSAFHVYENKIMKRREKKPFLSAISV